MSTEQARFPSDIVAKVAADFPHEPYATVLALLDEYEGAERLHVTR
jgi:hypothetical protein